MSLDILPDSRLRRIVTAKGSVQINGRWWEQVYCAACGKKGPLVPEEHMTSAFYLCDHPCGDQWGEVAGTYTMPDEVFFARLREEQLERHGRLLTPAEAAHQLDDVNSPLSRLVRDRRVLTPGGMF